MAAASSICVILAILGVITVRYIRLRFLLRDFPGPEPKFFLGNADMLLGKGGRAIPLHHVQRKLQKQYGDFVRFSLGSTPIVNVYDPAAVKEVLTSKFSSYRNRPDFVVPLIGKRAASWREGLVFNRSDSWGSVRAAYMPVFHSTTLQAMSADVTQAMLGIRSKIDAMLAEQTAGTCSAFDMHKLIKEVTFAVSFKVSFGIDMPSKEHFNKDNPLDEAIQTFFDTVSFSDIWSLLALNLPHTFMPLVCWLSSKLNPKAVAFSKSLDTIFAATQQMIAGYAAHHPELEIDATPDGGVLEGGLGLEVFNINVVPTENSLLANILRTRNKSTGKQFSPMQVLPQAYIMLMAAYDTTAVTTSMCVYCLAQNPEAEAKLLEEIHRNGRDTLPTNDTIDQWPYAQACVCETLRLFPATVPVREASKDTTLQGRAIPAGTQVFVASDPMHRDPRYFDNPESFLPERFVQRLSPEAQAAYTPFGSGPRKCIGLNLANLVATTAIVCLYQRYIFRLSEQRHPGGDIDLIMPMSLQPADGIWVTAVAQ